MRVLVLVNPYANRWRAGRRLEVLRSEFAAVGLSAEFVETRAPSDATAHAERAVQESFDGVVAAGGDGTISEVVNGLVTASIGLGDNAIRPALGIIPIGTGNDFADMLGVPRDIAAAVQAIAAGHTRIVDLGCVRFEADPVEPSDARASATGAARKGRAYYFDNNCGVGMEPLVTIENVRSRLSGNLRYIVSLIRALRKLKAWRMQIQWDGGAFDGPVLMLSVCNGPRTGGLFHMAPTAQFDDGLFDFVLVPEVSKWTVLRLLPALFRGRHVHHPKVITGRTATLAVRSDPGTPIHADGEVLGSDERSLAFHVLPKWLRVFVPEP